jgi:glycosyltransferase involved in cell wall biosynthesis
MNVLMVNHPGAEGFRGGDLVQMRKTAAALRYYGVRVVESLAPDPTPTGFDLAHVFNLRTARDTLTQLTHLKAFGIPVVLSPLYLEPAVGIWGSRAVAGLFQDDPAPDALTARLANLRDRNVTVTLPDGTVYTAQAANRPHPDFDRAQRAALGLVDFLLVNSLLELHALVRTLRVTHLPFAVAPLGIDPVAFRDPDPEPFVRRYGVRDFVLQVGRIEAPKNQLLLAVACRQAGLPLVLIGEARQPQYLEWVRKHGPDDLRVIPHLPQEELASAYAAARVHALPSWGETCGLVNLEAGACGAAVVAGTLGYELEYLRDLADYCDPADVDSIRTVVRTAWDRYPADVARRDQLRLRVRDQFTWKASALATFEAYCRVLGRS